MEKDVNKNMLGAIFAAALVTIGLAAAPASAATSCHDNIKDVEAKWNSIDKDSWGHPERLEDKIQIAREACAGGKDAEANKDLEVVRNHLGMPSMAAPAGGQSGK